MNKFKEITVTESVIDDLKYFLCMKCFYKTRYQIRAMIDHVLVIHCDLNRNIFKKCLKFILIKKVSKLTNDKNEGEFTNYCKQIKEKVKKNISKLSQNLKSQQNFLSVKSTTEILSKKVSTSFENVQNEEQFINYDKVMKESIIDETKDSLELSVKLKEEVSNSFSLKENEDEDTESLYSDNVREQQSLSSIVDTCEIITIITFDYCREKLKVFYENKTFALKGIRIKLEKFKNMKVGETIIENVKYFICFECYYKTTSQIGDMMRHIFIKHCDLDQKIFTECLRFILIQKEFTSLYNEDEHGLKNCEKRMNEESSMKGKYITKAYNNTEDVLNIVTTIHFDYCGNNLETFYGKKSKFFIENIKMKLEKFKEIKVGECFVQEIKYYVCMKCYYKTNHQLRNMISHALSIHCDFDHNYLNDCLKFILLKKVCNLQNNEEEEPKFVSYGKRTKTNNCTTQPKIMKQYKYNSTDEDSFEIMNTIMFDYNKERLEQYYGNNCPIFLENLKIKLNKFKDFKVGQAWICNKKYYICVECNYKTPHQLRDMMSHVLSIHCDFDHNVFNECVQFIMKKKISAVLGNKNEEDFTYYCKQTTKDNVKKKKSEHSNLHKELNKNSFSFDERNITEINDNENVYSNKKKRQRLSSGKVSTFDIVAIVTFDYCCERLDRNYKGTSSVYVEDLKVKLNKFKSITVGESIIDCVKHNICMECYYRSRYDLKYMIRHIFLCHCSLNNNAFTKCLKFILSKRVPNMPNVQNKDLNEKSSDLIKVVKSQFNDNIEKNGSVSIMKSVLEENNSDNVQLQEIKEQKDSPANEQNFDIVRIISFDYSEEEIETYLSNKPKEIQEDVKRKLRKFKEITVAEVCLKGVWYYICRHCDYKCCCNIRKIKSHIFFNHCYLKYSMFKECSIFITVSEVSLSNTKYKNIKKKKKYQKRKYLLNNEINEKEYENMEDKEEYKVLKGNKEEVISVINEENILNEVDESVEVATTFHLNISERVFKKYFLTKYSSIFSELRDKIKNVNKYLITLKNINGVKYFICMDCFYKSEKNINDIKAHVFLEHCFFSRDLLGDLYKVSMIDENYNLLNDRSMIRFINNTEDIVLEESENEDEINV